MWRWVVGVLVAIGLLAVGSLEPAVAQTASRKSAPRPAANAAPPTNDILRRDIIGIYDSAQEATPADTRLHRSLEMPLNHLGYRVIYWDIAKGPPPAAMTAGAIGFATWFGQSVGNAKAYFAWASAAVGAGKRAIVIEQPGLLGDAAELPAINGFLRTIGLEYVDYFVSETAKTRVLVADAALIGFERKVDQLAHHVVRIRSADVRGHLVLSDPGHVWSRTKGAAVVATGPRGGFIAPGFAIRFDETEQRQRWLVNPFAFLTAALGPTRFPIPDTTTISGRRLYFSHIDGDSWNGRSDLPGHPLAGRSSGEVILRDTVEPYGDLPVSVGLISSDIDPEHGGDAQAAETAAKYFALPHVEVASHTHTHPFEWEFYSAYNRVTELQRLLAYADRQPQATVADRTLAAVVKAAREQRLAPAAIQEPAVYDLPRAKVHRPFSITEEVQGALSTSSRLAPAGKPARLYLWSGNTSPGAEVIRATRAAGVRNMNGGDPRYDRAYPSVSYLSPIGKPVGAERQIYAAASNDFTYTNDWRGPYDGFAALSETLANTELPRRLKPFNIYYHMYSATRPEALAAVKQNLELARSSRIAPVTAATYAAIADAFYVVSFVQTAAQTWRVLDRGALQTIRFDAATDLVPDYAGSDGVIGHARHGGSLYVALDSAVTTVTVKLITERRGLAAARPWLSDSRWLVSDLTAARCQLTGRAQGFGSGEMRWGGVTPGRWLFQIRGQADAVEAVVSADGVLNVVLPGSAITPVEFEAKCA